jgi:hypothetical protein
MVFFQSRNKKYKNESIKRKATLNLTIRQVAKMFGVGKSTAQRWLIELKRLKVIAVANYKETKERHFNSMKFYYLKAVVKGIKKETKKRAYKVLKAMNLKRDTKKIIFNNLKEFDFFTRDKYKKFKKYNIKLLNSLDSDNFLVMSPWSQWFNPHDFDLRRKNLEKKRASSESIQLSFEKMLKSLSQVVSKP